MYPWNVFTTDIPMCYVIVDFAARYKSPTARYTTIYNGKRVQKLIL